MTRDDIIRMAREAQSVHATETWTFALSANQLERFATLVQQAERLRSKRRLLEVKAQRDVLLSLLSSIRGWDVLDATADGTYWKRDIDATIKMVEEGK